jgi:hypothetical protein
MVMENDRGEAAQLGLNKWSCFGLLYVFKHQIASPGNHMLVITQRYGLFILFGHQTLKAQCIALRPVVVATMPCLQ